VSGDNRIIATYKIAAIGGSWGAEDNGTYKIRLNSNRVFDEDANGARGRTLGSFRIKLPADAAASATNLSPSRAPGRMANFAIAPIARDVL
jgi:hypothetical protein